MYMIAGEPSGDLLGGRVMASLRQLAPEGVVFAGIGGQTMKAEGLASLFPMAELSVMGLVEVVAHLPNLLRRIEQTVEDILALRPSIVVSVDAPDFSFRVVRKVRARNPSIPLVHYVAPTVWAWRPGRAKKIAAFLDHLLALLPFEPPYFERAGLPCTFVGHWAAAVRPAGSADRFRAARKIAPGSQVVLLLPGSRKGEVSRLLPLCIEVARCLAASNPKLFFTFPTVATIAPMLREQLGRAEFPCAIIDDEAEKKDAFAAAQASLAASGTATLELALAGVPSVICYRVNGLSAFLARRLIRVPYVGLPNLILNREVMPEFLQQRASAVLIVPVLNELLADSAARHSQKAAFTSLANLLLPGGMDPSIRAATAILGLIAR